MSNKYDSPDNICGMFIMIPVVFIIACTFLASNYKAHGDDGKLNLTPNDQVEVSCVINNDEVFTFPLGEVRKTKNTIFIKSSNLSFEIQDLESRCVIMR